MGSFPKQTHCGGLQLVSMIVMLFATQRQLDGREGLQKQDSSMDEINK